MLVDFSGLSTMTTVFGSVDWKTIDLLNPEMPEDVVNYVKENSKKIRIDQRRTEIAVNLPFTYPVLNKT